MTLHIPLQNIIENWDSLPIPIADLDFAEVYLALVTAHPLDSTKDITTVEDMRNYIAQQVAVMCEYMEDATYDIDRMTYDPIAYDASNGKGEAARVIEALRERKKREGR